MTFVLWGVFAIVTGAVWYLLVCAAYNVVLVLNYRRTTGPDAPPESVFAEADLPRVTIQLPVYNEGFLAEQVLRLAAALDYPHEKLEIQYLDDSDDIVTSQLAARVIAELQKSHPAIAFQNLDRGDRTGFKAGALKYGTERATGEFLAVFDADFQIPSDFLRRMVHYFNDQSVGAVQARWDFTNSRKSLFTYLQATKIDLHQMVEQSGRANVGLAAIFHGTAGIWRRTALEDAGGWNTTTEVEDVEISVNAALKGWRIHYLDRLRVKSELPESVNGFLRQQMRWRRGWVRVAVGFTPKIIASKLPFLAKVDLLMRLNLIWCSLAALIVTIGVLPYLMIADEIGLYWPAISGYWALLLASIITRRVEGTVQSEYPEPREIYNLPKWIAVLPLGYLLFSMGTLWPLTQATFQGFRKRRVWEVTPKSGTTTASTGHMTINRDAGLPVYAVGTLVLSLVGLALSGVSLLVFNPLSALFYGLMTVGTGYIGLQLIDLYRPGTRLGPVVAKMQEV